MKSILMSLVASLLILSGCSEVKKSTGTPMEEAPQMIPTPSQGEIIATLRFPSQYIGELSWSRRIDIPLKKMFN